MTVLEVGQIILFISCGKLFLFYAGDLLNGGC